MGVRGAIRGIGQGLVWMGQQRIQAQEQEARDQRLVDRQMALARFEDTITERREQRQATIQGDARQDAAKIEVVKERAILAERQPYRVDEHNRTVAAQAARDEAQAAREAARDEQNHRQAVELETIRHNNSISKSDYEWARNQEEENDRIAEWRVTNDGALAGYNRRGHLEVQGRPGVYLPPRSGQGEADSLFGSAPAPSGDGSDHSLSKQGRGDSPLAPAIRVVRGAGERAPVRVRTMEEARRLPSGTPFVWEGDGVPRVRQ